MSSPLYQSKFVHKAGATVKVELSIIHPDVFDFGTDRLFAWKLLSEWVSPPEDGDDIAMASRYVKRVEVSGVANGKVTETGDDFIVVKRAGKKPPTVIYTIEVTDPALLQGVEKGDGDEVYAWVERGRGKAVKAHAEEAKAAPKKTKAAKAKALPAASGPPKTYDDFRNKALELIAGNAGSWSDDLIDNGIVQRWAKDASNTEVKGWLGHLRDAQQAKGAALIAIDRLRAGEPDAANELRRFAESKHAPSDSYNDFHALQGLVPLWWQLGENERAKAGFDALTAHLMKSGNLGNQTQHTLLTVAARGGQWDAVMKLVPTVLVGTYRCDLLVPGAFEAFVSGEQKVFDAIMARWTAAAIAERRFADGDLSVALARHLLDRPADYLELLIAWPKVIGAGLTAALALTTLERADAQAAVAIGERILANDDLPCREQVVSILARHAPERAKAFAKTQSEKWKGQDWALGFLAAVGDDEEPRAVVEKGLPKRNYSAIARSTSDRGLATEALKMAFAHRADGGASLLAHLVTLGERRWVDSYLEDTLETIAAMTPKERDLPCRTLASAAAMLGRPDLVFAAIKLPGPSMRRYSAGDSVAGFVSVGDFTNALAALELVPDGDANGRVSTAVQRGLRVVDEGFLDISRAMPLRVSS